MKYEELAYKSTGPILQVGGAAYMIKGIVTGNAEEFGVGFSALIGGMLVSGRTKYVTETVNRLNERISGLEEKLEK